jgi:RNA polymerase sigma factor (sigma-70 family)
MAGGPNQARPLDGSGGQASRSGYSCLSAEAANCDFGGYPRPWSRVACRNAGMADIPTAAAVTTAYRPHPGSDLVASSGAPLPGGPPDASPALGPETLGTLLAGLRLMAQHRLRDPDLAEEVAQETLARAIQALADAPDGEIRDLGAFVHGIARHVIADVQRSRVRQQDVATLDNVPDPRATEDALGHAVRAEEHEQVRAALSRLSVADRTVLHLSFFEGLSCAELAERLGEPATRVRKRKSRALERLRHLFFLGESGRHSGTPGTTDIQERRGSDAADPGDEA